MVLLANHVDASNNVPHALDYLGSLASVSCLNRNERDMSLLISNFNVI
jgi:hypothetical protein